jgi:malate permease and related proteins
MLPQLIKLYGTLGLGVGLGWLLGQWLPESAPTRLGKFLFWVGVPIGIFTFLRQTDLTGPLWVAGLVAWAVMLTGLGLGQLWWSWSRGQQQAQPRATQGSLLLASMAGNTGYLGFPIVLLLVGKAAFAWALFYDLLGTALGAYGLGVVLASRFGTVNTTSRATLLAFVTNPAMISFALGLLYRQPFPAPLEQGLTVAAWTSIGLSLPLIGMRLAHLPGQPIPTALRRHIAVTLAIKMLLLPLLVYAVTTLAHFGGDPQRVLVLEAAMSPAFATLVLAETYGLDRVFAVTTVTLGSLGLLLLLPLWLLLLGSSS